MQQRLVRCRSQDVDGSPVPKPAAMFGVFALNIGEKGNGQSSSKQKGIGPLFFLATSLQVDGISIESHVLCFHPSKRHLQSSSTPAHVRTSRRIWHALRGTPRQLNMCHVTISSMAASLLIISSLQYPQPLMGPLYSQTAFR
ncbi:hypothetical protein BJX99DRAFT_104027 [Aspergillus californicus]